MKKARTAGTASGMAAVLFAALLAAALAASVSVAGSRGAGSTNDAARATAKFYDPAGEERAGGAGSTNDAARATAKFHDLAVAKRAGYGLLKDKNGVSCIAMDEMPGMGAMGVHYAKSSLVADGALNVSTPEAIVYAPGAGKPRLAALEYVVLKSAWDAKHASPPSLFGHRFSLTPAGNRYGLPAFYSLHAWIWKHNPAGTFAMWNPEVTCR